MADFKLTIVTPDGLAFEGPAEQLTVRTTVGEVGILAHHIDFVAPLGMGRAAVRTAEGTRYAACIGGMVSVSNGDVTLVPTTFEWAEDIDVSRADAAADRARSILDNKSASTDEVRLAQARLRRALVRSSVGGLK